MAIGIFGYGVVGNAQATVLNQLGYHFVVHDPEKGEILTRAENGLFVGIDVAFICLPAPTLEDGNVDGGAIYETLERLPDKTTVIIRSTIIPGTTDALQVCFPKLDVYFVPEFLSEDTARVDALRPSRLIIGLSQKSEGRLLDFTFGEDAPPGTVNVRSFFPESIRNIIWMPARDAEASKYAANGFYALKVAFMNQMCDYVKASGGNWENVHTAITCDPMVAPFHTQVNHKGYRGYGGKCLPKDAAALIHASRTHGAPITTLEAADSYNRKLRGL